MMLNLQIVLLGMGIIVVLVVYVLSKRRHGMQDSTQFAAAKRAGDVEESSHPSGFARLRSRFGDPHGDNTPEPRQPLQPQPAEDARPPRVTPTANLSEQGGSRFNSRTVLGFARLSQIDYWVKITGQRDVGRETVLAIYCDGASHFTKANHIYGRKVAQQQWFDVQHEAESSRFSDLVLSIQLADHNGALSESEMARFLALVEKLSECTERKFVLMTSAENAVAQANAIAEFVKHFDSVCALNIIPQSEQHFVGTAIERCAVQVGLKRHGNYYSRFKPDATHPVALYSLAAAGESGHFHFANLAALRTSGVTFFTRPAINHSPEVAFSEMLDAAQAFAARIKGVVTLPGHNELHENQVYAVRESIQQSATEMAQLGIAAGSDEAMRIFNVRGVV